MSVFMYHCGDCNHLWASHIEAAACQKCKSTRISPPVAAKPEEAVPDRECELIKSAMALLTLAVEEEPKGKFLELLSSAGDYLIRQFGRDKVQETHPTLGDDVLLDKTSLKRAMENSLDPVGAAYRRYATQLGNGWTVDMAALKNQFEKSTGTPCRTILWGVDGGKVIEKDTPLEQVEASVKKHVNDGKLRTPGEVAARKVAEQVEQKIIGQPTYSVGAAKAAPTSSLRGVLEAAKVKGCKCVLEGTTFTVHPDCKIHYNDAFTYDAKPPMPMTTMEAAHRKLCSCAEKSGDNPQCPSHGKAKVRGLPQLGEKFYNGTTLPKSEWIGDAGTTEPPEVWEKAMQLANDNTGAGSCHAEEAYSKPWSPEVGSLVMLKGDVHELVMEVLSVDSGVAHCRHSWGHELGVKITHLKPVDGPSVDEPKVSDVNQEDVRGRIR
jgi:hypothetical protein